MATIRYIIELIDKYWKFDESQYPISSWHDKQDLLREIAALDKEQLAEQVPERTAEEIEELFKSEFGHQPTKANKYRLQGIKWILSKFASQSVNLKTVLEDLITTIEKNSVDNIATISNVKLWAEAWRREIT
jgi:hypothetical protein